MKFIGNWDEFNAPYPPLQREKAAILPGCGPENPPHPCIILYLHVTFVKLPQHLAAHPPQGTHTGERAFPTGPAAMAMAKTPAPSETALEHRCALSTVGGGIGGGFHIAAGIHLAGFG